MQPRHRIPMVFNLSMVDVLCCALGCVILLWLVNSREAKRKAQAAGETGSQLVQAKVELASIRGELTSSQTEREQVQALLEKTQNERDRAQHLVQSTRRDLDKTRAALQTAQADLSALQKDVKKLQIANSFLAGDLGKKSKEVTGLDQRLALMDRAVLNVQKELREKNALLNAAREQVEDLTDRLESLRSQEKTARSKLAAAGAQSATQEKDLAKLKKELVEVNNLYRKLLAGQTALDRELLLRGKEVTENRLTIADLEREKRALEDRIRIARQAADNRFAGITLTGRKVVFLVDMSGSMDLIDEQTLAPNKWPLLCETLVKIMKSLPDLTDYQIILFSDKTKYLLGNKRRWLPYDGETSPKKVYDALRKVKAEGGTNMSAAFAETFEFRALGMDTVYVFSDGLPNMGEGLPPGAENLPEAQKTGYCTKYVRRMLKEVWNRPLPGRPTVHINSIGFFFESPDVGAFLWAMSREHEGSFVGMSKP